MASIIPSREICKSSGSTYLCLAHPLRQLSRTVSPTSVSLSVSFRTILLLFFARERALAPYPLSYKLERLSRDLRLEKIRDSTLSCGQREGRIGEEKSGRDPLRSPDEEGGHPKSLDSRMLGSRTRHLSEWNNSSLLSDPFLLPRYCRPCRSCNPFLQTPEILSRAPRRREFPAN